MDIISFFNTIHNIDYIVGTYFFNFNFNIIIYLYFMWWGETGSYDNISIREYYNSLSMGLHILYKIGWLHFLWTRTLSKTKNIIIHLKKITCVFLFFFLVGVVEGWLKYIAPGRKISKYGPEKHQTNIILYHVHTHYCALHNILNIRLGI